MSEIAELLDKLAAGHVTLGAVAANFATRHWVTTKRPQASSYAEAAARELDDPEPIQEGTWGEVMAAYTAGKISDDEYRVLFAARSGTMNTAPPQ